MTDQHNDPDNLRERISLGECVSDRGVDHCPVCIDCCEASHWRVNFSSDLKELDIKTEQKP